MDTRYPPYQKVKVTKAIFVIVRFIALAAIFAWALMFHIQLATATHINNVGASLYLQPASGTVVLESTFSISVFVNTNGHDINAVDVKMSFPADKLQVVSPTAGRSIISVWVAQPVFSNTQGTMRFQGGIPDPGINTDAGLISTVVFRARRAGSATITIESDSRVLLNDGLGTNILSKVSGAQFNVILPPPAGPEVVSPTHPDQTTWYRNRNPLLRWSVDVGITGFSYVLDREPLNEPDNQSEGLNTSASFQNLSDGIWYFHLKALGLSSSGPTTNFAIMIDGSPPAVFEPQVKPNRRTTNQTPIISFITTDAASGLDHYEIKFIEIENPKNPELTPFFIEATSPFQAPQLAARGVYDVVVRAFDRAGNITDAVVRLEILDPLLGTISDRGVRLGVYLMPWWIFYLIADILIIVLALLLYKLHRRHNFVNGALMKGLHWVEYELAHDIRWLEDKLKGRKHIHYEFKERP